MSTGSITHSVTINTQEQAEKLCDALEQAEQINKERTVADGLTITDNYDISSCVSCYTEQKMCEVLKFISNLYNIKK